MGKLEEASRRIKAALNSKVKTTPIQSKTKDTVNRVVQKEESHDDTLTLTHVGKDQLATLDYTVPVISISDRYSNDASIPGEKAGRPILRLYFFTGDYSEFDEKDYISVQQIVTVIAFIKEQVSAGRKKIYVQCGEGRIRSYTVASALRRYLDLGGTEVIHCNNESNIKNGVIDRCTYNRMVDFLVKE